MKDKTINGYGKGELAGIILIQNLVNTYKLVNTDMKPENQPLSTDRLNALIKEMSELKGNVDIYERHVFYAYRNLYTFIVRETTKADVCIRDIQASIWRLSYILDGLYNAEYINKLNALNDKIKVMTKEQYSSIKKKPKITMVIEDDNLEEYDTFMNEDNFYKIPFKTWEDDLTESFLESYSEFVEEELHSLEKEVKNWYAINTVTKIIGELIDVKDIDILTGELPLSEIVFFNQHIIKRILDLKIIRPSGANQSSTQLENKLEKLIKPLRTNELKPSQKKINQVKKIIKDIYVLDDIEVVHKIYEILEG